MNNIIEQISANFGTRPLNNASLKYIYDHGFILGISEGNLINFNIPDGVTEIGREAFDGCTSLRSITIPDGITAIGKDAFKGSTSLQSVSIDV